MAAIYVYLNLTVESLMILVYGTVSESIPDLLPEVKKKKSQDRRLIPQNDSFIIAAEPKRRGAMTINKNVRSNKQTNSYVLVEFGLELFHVLMKKKKFQDTNYAQFMNPIVQLLRDSLKSHYLRVIMFSVKCLTIMWHNQLELEQMSENVEQIVVEIFAILHKYASNEVSRKDNHYLLVKTTFKAVVILLKNVTYYTVNETQLKTLLLYVEQDLFNHDKDTMAFTLMKSILDRKLIVPEVHGIVKKVAEISVTSELDERRTVTRPIVLTYLMEYPVGKKIDSLLKFFIAQLNYVEISGRDSAIEMLILIFKHFPQIMLRKFSGLFFLSLGTRLVNDESPECRKKIAEAIELLIKQIDNNPRQQLYDVVVLLMDDDKLIHREMAAQLLIRFVNAENKEFIKRIPKILPLLVKSLVNDNTNNNNNDEMEIGKFVKVKKHQKCELDEDDDEAKDEQTALDHHLIQTMNAIIRILELKEDILKDPEFRDSINVIGYQCQHLISHDHIWVRLRALKIIHFMVNSLDVVEIQQILCNNDEQLAESRSFLYAKSELRAIVFDMVVQIKPEVDNELLASIMENILNVSNILKQVPIEDIVNDKRDFNLLWLIRRLRYAIHAEIAMTPALYTLRKSIFEYFEALVAIIDKETISKLASSMLTPLMREMVEGEHVINDLKILAIRVGNRVKSKIGHQIYDQVRVELQSKMLRKRVDRRKALAQDKINNPAKAATRAIYKQLKKSDVKKRKRQSLQDGIFLPKKRRVFGVKMNDTYE
jgi:U3 small nucleolar RNA-associated protein 20